MVLEPHERPSFDLPTKELHRLPWQCDAPIIVQLISFKRQPIRLHLIEKHMHVTESRMHIGGPPCVIVVAAPSEAVPGPTDLRAFRMERQGVMFKTSTWHAVDAYPLGDDPSVFLFLSDKETQSELFDNPVAEPKRSVIHDLTSVPVAIKID
jgi:ureidoglycolate hydrolase